MPVLKTFIFGTWLACGLPGALIGGLRSGFEGGVLGFVAGLAARWLVVRGMLWFINARQQKGPAFPPCANGVCSGNDYKVTHEGPTGVLYTCRCGGAYVLESAGLFHGVRFDRVEEGGALQPYMVRRPFSHWRPLERDRQS
jgi:hypothetical protein